VRRHYYRKLFSLFILLLGAGWVWWSRIPPGQEGTAIAAPQTGFRSPDFALQTLNGEVISLSEVMGSPLIINFWASWCPPCKAEMPTLEKVFQEYRERGVLVLGVNTTQQDNPTQVASFVQRLNLSFPILLDDKGEVSRKYQVQSLPTTFFIRNDGVIAEVVVGGPMSEASIRARIERLLEKTTP